MCLVSRKSVRIFIFILCVCQVAPTRAIFEKMTWRDKQKFGAFFWNRCILKIVHVRIHWKPMFFSFSRCFVPFYVTTVFVDTISIIVYEVCWGAEFDHRLIEMSPTYKCSHPPHSKKKHQKNKNMSKIWVFLRCFKLWVSSAIVGFWFSNFHQRLGFWGFFCVSKEVLKRGEARPRHRETHRETWEVAVPGNPGGGFKYVSIFTPVLGERIPILTSILFKWVATTN